MHMEKKKKTAFTGLQRWYSKRLHMSDSDEYVYVEVIRAEIQPSSHGTVTGNCIPVYPSVFIYKC